MIPISNQLWHSRSSNTNLLNSSHQYLIGHNNYKRKVSASSMESGHMTRGGVEDLVSMQKAKAPFWQHFRFKLDTKREPENISEATCKLCLMKVAASGGNTFNLHTHLQVQHKSEAHL